MIVLALISMNLKPYSSANDSPLSLLTTRKSDRSHLLPIINISLLEVLHYKQ